MERESTYLGPPYGPVSNLRTVFDTWRDRSMPEQIDKDWLERVGISPNLTAKNLHALRFLGLIDEQGYTTSVASRLRIASSEEYPSVLEEILRKAYRLVFEIRDPSTDSRTRIDDAFRKELPQAQRSRMVALFMGLCQMALISLKEAPPARGNRESRGASKPKTTQPPLPTPAREGPRYTPPPDLVYRTSGVPPTAVLDPILTGLINTLSQIESVEELDQWYGVFKSAFSLVNNLRVKAKSEVA
jgi:hypothetical protein